MTTNGDQGFRIAFGRVGLFGAIFLIGFLGLTAVTMLVDTNLPPWPTACCAGLAALFIVLGR